MPWLTITSALRGTGNAVVIFNVAPSIAGRSGTISVNGRVFTVWQSVNACAEANFPLTQTFAPALGSSYLLWRDFNSDGINDILSVAALFPGDWALSVATGKREGGYDVPRLLPLGYSLSSYASSMEAADFNRDGKLDVALVDLSFLYINFGTNTGGLSAPQRYPLTIGGLDLTVGDFNGDQFPDVVVGSGFGSSLAMLLNDGAGKLQAEKVIRLTETPARVVRLVAGDFTADGKLDLLYLAHQSFSLLLLPGTGAGTFQPGTSYNYIDGTVGGALQPVSLSLSDVTGDGRMDALVAFDKGVGIVPGRIGGGFDRATVYLRGQSLEQAYGGDFNGDGLADIATVNFSEVNLLRGLGAGRFAEPKTYLTQGAVYTYSASLALDWNRDGLTDLALTTPDLNPQAETQGLAVVFGSRANGLSAAPGVTLPLAPTASAFADFNGDGLTDALLARGNLNDDKGYVAAYFGNSAGGFNQTATYPVLLPAQLETLDVNQDSAPDFIVTSQSRASVSIWLNNGRGAFAQTAELESNRGAPDFVAGDFNDDGKLDLLTRIPSDVDWQFLAGNGNGTFRAPVGKLAFGYLRALRTGDFNGDGKLDVVSWARGGCGDEPAAVWLGNGQGGFTAGPKQNLRKTAWAIVTGDVNGDGRTDLIASLCAGGERLGLAVILAEAQGFAAPQYYTEGEDATPLLADVNGDGKLDVLASARHLYLNRGDGTFAYQRIATETSQRVVATTALGLADVNQDGLADLLTLRPVSDTSARLYVIRNQSRCLLAGEALATSAASFLGLKPAVESIASLFGANLASTTRSAPGTPLPTTLGETSLSLKDSTGIERQAPLFFVSAGLVNFQIPAGTALGPAIIRVMRNSTVVATAVLEVTSVNPGLFAADASGSGYPAALVLRIRSNGTQVYESLVTFNSALNRFVAIPIDISNPAEQVFLVLYATGLRKRTALTNVTATIGGLNAEVLFAGTQGALVGVDQVNIRLPRELAGSGDVELIFAVDGKAANVVRVSIK